MATKLDVEFRLDETLTIDANLKGPTGSAVDLSTFATDEVQWGIAESQGSTRIATLQIGTGIEITDATAGSVRVEYGTTSQADLTPGHHYHELRAETDDGISIQFAGRARVFKSIFMSTSS